MKSPSNIQILVDGEDVTQRVLYAQTSFTMQMSAIPGEFTVTIKDEDHTFTPVSGKKIRILIDGLAFGGYIKRLGRKHFFPVVDSTVPSSVERMWALRGPDFNILFDKLVMHNEDNYFAPLVDPGGQIGDMVKYVFNHFIDAPAGLDVSSETDHPGDYPAGLFTGQGTYLRDQMEDFAQYGGASYWIDGDFKVHFHRYRDVVSDWGFTDWIGRIDRQKWIGFREASYDEDGMQMVTDALVWGGSSLSKDGSVSGEAVGTVFARYPDPPANTLRIPGQNAWRSRLDGDITEDAEEIKVTTVQGAPDPYFDVEIDDEKLIVTKVTGRTLTVTRGFPRAPHKDRARVVSHREPPTVLHASEEQDAIERLAEHGRWQRAEMRPGQSMYLLQESVDLRAYTIVAGAPGIDPATGIDGGLGRPLKTFSLTWFAHDVPRDELGDPHHLVPGDIVSFILYTMGKNQGNPLSFSLPLRSLRVSFPTLPSDNDAHEMLTYVRFEGDFGIYESDPRYLWRFMDEQRRRRNRSRTSVGQVAGNNTTAAVNGAEGRFSFRESPDGSATDFSIPFGYYAGTTQVYMNGLLQRPSIEYQEVDPGAGIIRFLEAPESDDSLYMLCRVNGGA